MGALGRVRRKVEGAEAKEIGQREFALAVDRAAKKRGMPLEAYVELAVLRALECDGVVHVVPKGEGLEICFAPEECSGHA